MRDNVPEELLVKNLAEAIQKALKSSKTVRKAIEAIENEGHECILSFSAAVILNDDEATENYEDSEDFLEDDKEGLFEFDENDIEFLKSININPDKTES
ncbi:hypothetical protein KKB18_05005 [bacterium]|nr:hypothetical protein [bacterium]